MRAELKAMVIREVTPPLEHFRPEHAGDFGLSLRLDVGPEGEHSSDAFDLFVCTPDHLRREQREAIWGRGLLIVQDFDLPAIRAVIERYLGTCHAADWPEIAAQVSRIAIWEFEDHRNGTP